MLKDEHRQANRAAVENPTFSPEEIAEEIAELAALVTPAMATQPQPKG